MLLTRLCIKNYKSLRDVEFEPAPLSVLVGPNGAGKSNFASAIDFLSDIYRHGLESAVARKGGYENIAFRRQRRSRSAISFAVTIDLSPDEFQRFLLPPSEFDEISLVDERMSTVSKQVVLRLTHRFSFKAESQVVGAAFEIGDECFEAHADRSPRGRAASEVPLAEFVRTDPSGVCARVTRRRFPTKELRHQLDDEAAYLNRFGGLVGPQQLAFAPRRYPGSTAVLANALAGCQVFHFDPLISRAPGVPTPNPTLTTTGENLPAVIAWVKENRGDLWRVVIDAMREVVPDLDKIDVDYLHTKRLGLFFREHGNSKPWTADDVSDGTIRTLAFLVALVDPRNTALCIEELENSVHPWIISTIIKRLREVSEGKSILLTTHSPIVVDAFTPSETWVVYKKAGESRVKNMLDLDPTMGAAWEKGEFALSDYLGSGLLPHAVPGGDL